MPALGQKAGHAALVGASVIIWTTTPWTMPGNRAVAFGDDIDYAVMTVNAAADCALTKVGDCLVLAVDLTPAVLAEIGVTDSHETARLTGRDIAGTVVAHPMAERVMILTCRCLPAVM